MATITILGSGFSALTTVRDLRRQGFDGEITVVSPRDALHYLPSSIWLPAGLRNGESLKVPLAGFFARNTVRHVPASVTGLTEGGRVVHTDTGEEIRNDHLVIATGGRFLRKLPGIEHALIPCEGIAVGEEIARRLADLKGGTIAVGFASNPKEQGAVRGGPMFEFLFIIDALLRRQGRRDQVKLVFFNLPRPGQRLGDRAVDGLLKEMARRDIETHLGHKMVRFEADKVVTEGGEFPADLILFMPGLTGPAWLGNTDLPLSPGGMIAADEFCRVTDREGLWVVGDAGSFPGPDWLPKQAHQADLQAKAAALNIMAVLKGGPPTTRFKAELVCIVDMLDKAMLVYRSERFGLLGPKMKLFHWLKRAFERHYLRAYR